MDKNSKQILKAYSFEIPDAWYDATDLWLFDNTEALGVIAQCIQEHEQWGYKVQDDKSEPFDLYNAMWDKWEDLPTNIINDCRQQIVRFNKIAEQEVGKLTLLDNGEIGKLQSATFRFCTDEERVLTGKETLVCTEHPLLTVDAVVDMGDGTAYYMDNCYGIRWIDKERALMPSFEMSRLSREVQAFIRREKTKIVSMDEWKKRKERERKSLTNHAE